MVMVRQAVVVRDLGVLGRRRRWRWLGWHRRGG